MKKRQHKKLTAIPEWLAVSFFYLKRNNENLNHTFPQRPARDKQNDRQQDFASNDALDSSVILPFRKAQNIQQKGSHDQKCRQDHCPRAKGKEVRTFPSVKGRHEHGKDIQCANRQQSAQNTVRRRANKGNYFFHGRSSFAVFCISIKSRLFIPK